MRKLWALVALAFLFPAAAGAKWQGDLRMCGTNGCRIIDRQLGHEHSHLLSVLSTWPSSEGPARPAAFYRLTIVARDSRGRSLGAESPPIYVVPSALLTRNEDGWGGAFWTRRDTPWTDFNASLWVGRRLDLIIRDGEIVPIPRALAERVRRAHGLR